MSSNNEAIYKILEARLRSIVDVPTIVSENVQYDPSVGTAFVRTRFMPGARRAIDVGQNPLNRIEGIYMVSLYHPINVGSGPGLILGDIVLDNFPPHSVLSSGSDYVEIMFSEMSMGFPNEKFYCTPVTIGWFAHN